MERYKGFTLVELAIVVILLGILAAIIIPQFSHTAQDARESALATALRIARSQIEHYILQHTYPPHLDEKGKFKKNQFVLRLTEPTDPSGQLDPNGTRGPYLSAWPANPFCEPSKASKIKFADAPAPPRDGKSGWYYCKTTCLLSANSTSGGEAFDP